MEPDEADSGLQRRRSQHRVEQIAPMSQADEFYYVDTRPNHSYSTRVYVTNQPDYGDVYDEAASHGGHYPQDDLYEGPQYDGEFLDPNEGYPQRNPVDRRQSRKNMGKAIVTGLNTARVKEIKGRLRPAFSPDELIDSVERRNPVGGGPQDVIENVDVSGMSIMERMKVLESKAASSNKGPPPPTYPKPRPVSFGAITVQPIPHHSGRHSGGQSGSPSSSVLNDRPAIPPSRNDRPAIPSSRSEPRLPVAAPSSRPTSQIALDEAPWYFGSIDQNRCEEKLKVLNTEGAFLIRLSKKGETRMQPYTLCVFHENDIYNLMIRQKTNNKLAVGSEKNGEPEFATLADLVKFHADIPIEIIPKSKSRKTSGGKVWLKMTPLK